jgi:RNA polymerase sigma factor (sigma-70 family)
MDDLDSLAQPSASQPSASTDEIAAFSEFYRKFVPTLVAFLVWQGARLPDATDIAQDTMIKAYQRWSEIRQPQAWARTVASRALASRMASSKEDPVDHLPESSTLLATSFDVEAWERRHEVLRALDRLPPRQRQVMAWTLDGYTPGEIAEELRISPEAVRANLMKARRSLVVHLNTPQDER